MKQIVLNIEDSKFKAFFSFIKTLDSVSVSNEEVVTAWQQEAVNKRIQLVEDGEMTTRKWDEAKKDIF